MENLENFDTEPRPKINCLECQWFDPIHKECTKNAPVLAKCTPKYTTLKDMNDTIAFVNCDYCNNRVNLTRNKMIRGVRCVKCGCEYIHYDMDGEIILEPRGIPTNPKYWQ